MLIYQRFLTLSNHNLCWQSWKPMVSLNPPWVWWHPIYWVVNRGFVCTVCAQVIQSRGRDFHRGPSSGYCCLIYSLMTWIMRSRTCLWDYTLMTRLCMHRMSLPLPCNLLWTGSQPPVRVVQCKLLVDKQCQDASPSDRSLQVRFWLNFQWFWRYLTSLS